MKHTLTVTEDGKVGVSKPTKLYSPCANNATYANNEHPCGLQPNLPPLRTMETMRLNPLPVNPYVAKFANVADPQNQPLTRMDSDKSLIPLKSQAGLENPDAGLEDAEVF